MQDNVPAAIAAQAKANGLTNLAPAYIKAWGEIGTGVVKDRNNPHFGSEYATLHATLEAGKEKLAANGLALLQAPGAVVDGSIEIIGMLLHTSGEAVTFKTLVPLGGKLTAQSVGSAITYGRRYQALAVFGLAPVDDDGNAASEPPAPRKVKVVKEPTPAAGENGYADMRDELLDTIEAFAGSYDDFEKSIRPLVEDLGDAEVNKAFVTKRKSLKKGK
jgi:hypothetical protein